MGLFNTNLALAKPFIVHTKSIPITTQSICPYCENTWQAGSQPPVTRMVVIKAATHKTNVVNTVCLKLTPIMHTDDKA